MEFIANGPMKLGPYLRSVGFSVRAVQRVKHHGIVLVNGEPAHMNFQLRGGEQISVTFPQEAPSALLPAPVPIDIVYEDEALLIVNKPAGMPVYPIREEMEKSLGNAVMWHFQQTGYSGPFRPVGRLDRSTTGLMAIAKNQYVCAALSEQTGTKTYYALIEGAVEPAAGEILAPIKRQEALGLRRCVAPDGQYAKTVYETDQMKNGYSLMKVRIFTGRTHQIRVHFAHLGHPLVGDWLYGKETEVIPRPALHAGELTLTHPLAQDVLTFHAPLPADMQALLE